MLVVMDSSYDIAHLSHAQADRGPKPIWMWCSAADAAPTTEHRWWQLSFRRFNLEHTFRPMK
ncbi:hypothetical protein [Kitasatospora sp. NPDC056184]|uniref:hypothetical protein n=1 Tax=Kitasatospora sp. NPDC056184 TaxID=3345738 RepID=UPI0035D9A1E4